MVAIVIKIDYHQRQAGAIFDLQGFQTAPDHLGFNVAITEESYKMLYNKGAKTF